MKDNMILCPKCAGVLRREGGSLVCESHHTFDIAASGYVNLNIKNTPSGDSSEMVSARSRFLEIGYYEAFARAVARAAGDGAHDIIVDAGCGEGYYSVMLARELESARVYGFDLSKSAVAHAAKRARRENVDAEFFVCGIFELPLADSSADVVVNLFAPCAREEFHRVLKPGGRLIMGVAGEDHLLGLKRAVYDDVYLNRPEKAETLEGFELIGHEKIKYDVTLEGAQSICDLFAMTPYYWKTSAQDREKLERLERLDTVLDFDIMIFERSKDVK